MKAIRGPAEIILRAERFLGSLELGSTPPYAESTLIHLEEGVDPTDAIGAAAYLGEVICRNLNGEWRAPEGLGSEVEPFVAVGPAQKEVRPFEVVSAEVGRGILDLYRRLKSGTTDGVPLSSAAPLRKRWMEVWVMETGPFLKAVVATITENVTYRSAEIIPMLEAPPASIGRFDNIEEGWRLANVLARAGAGVETRALLA